VRDHLLILLLALMIDAAIGDPDWLWRRLRHPVAWFGWLIDYADKIGNHDHFSPSKRRFHGFIAIWFLVGLATIIGWLLSWFCQLLGEMGILVEAIISSLFLAQRSLACHVHSVYLTLKNEGISTARGEVAKIVGRDPDQLDEVGLCRAAIESLSENSSDGIIAPACWFLLLGLPGLLAYKMLNTADSMIGHNDDRYREFGRCTARADDLANLLPARLTMLLIAATTLIRGNFQDAKATIRVSFSDAKKHRSPNAGWPESAYAGALGISLAGPRSYGKQQIEASFQNEAGRPPCLEDIKRALSLFWSSMMTFFIILLLLYSATSAESAFNWI